MRNVALTGHLDVHRQTLLSVIVVNYGTADLTLNAIGSALAQNSEKIRLDVHVVDNASPGDDAQTLARNIEDRGWNKDVTLYPSPQNHGFGRGNNLVLSALSERTQPPQNVLLLNPDAVLQPGAIKAMTQFFERTPKAAFAGAQVTLPDGSPRVAAFRFPNIAATFSEALGLGPIVRATQRWQVPLPPSLPEGRVDWVTGAAVMIRFDVLKKLGGFDPGYFLYYEEVDLMYRAAQHGWETWYVPSARAAHIEGAATGVKSRERRRLPGYWYDSWLHFHRNNYGRMATALMSMAWLLGAALEQVHTRLRGRAPRNPPHLFRDFWAYAGRPQLGLRPLRHG